MFECCLWLSTSRHGVYRSHIWRSGYDLNLLSVPPKTTRSSYCVVSHYHDKFNRGRYSMVGAGRILQLWSLHLYEFDIKLLYQALLPSKHPLLITPGSNTDNSVALEGTSIGTSRLPANLLGRDFLKLDPYRLPSSYCSPELMFSDNDRRNIGINFSVGV